MAGDINPNISVYINTTKGPESNEDSKNKIVIKKGNAFSIFGKAEAHYNDDTYNKNEIDEKDKKSSYVLADARAMEIKKLQTKSLRQLAKDWFQEVEGLTPPYVINCYKGSDAEKYDNLKRAFVDYIDRNFDEFPPKKQLYEILDSLKKNE